NVGSVYQVYDPNTFTFLEYDADDQVGTASPIIAKGQGFYIDGSSTSEIIFEEAHKATTNTPLVRSSSAKKNYFTLHLNGTGESDKTRIKIRDGASLGKDRYESYKFQLLPVYWGMTTPWDEFTS